MEKRTAYFNRMRRTCLSLRGNKRTGNCLVQKVITRIVPHMRNYEIEIKGAENVPKEGNALFLCNHSNAHDFLTMQEVFEKTECDITFLASNEGIGVAIKKIFIACGGVMIDRNDRLTIEKGIMDFCSNILNGMSGVIFGESTWNLHPYRPMQQIKTGAVHIAAIAKVPIVPTIFEYVEIPKVCAREKEIYHKVVVKFSAPVNISETDGLFAQTDRLQIIMEQERMNLWKELGIVRNSLEDINMDVYLNHTYLKKFDAFGFSYDTNREMKVLLSGGADKSGE